MKVINIPQRSKEWHEYRRTRIGATDFSCYCHSIGLCSKPFYSFDTQIKNKVLEIEIPANKYMLAGIENEPRMRIDANDYFDINGMDMIVQSDFNDRIFASLDLYDPFDNINVELKFSKKEGDSLLKAISHYTYQVLHQSYVIKNIKKSYLYIEHSEYSTLNILEFDRDKLENIMTYNKWMEHCNLCLIKLDDDIVKYKGDK